MPDNTTAWSVPWEGRPVARQALCTFGAGDVGGREYRTLELRPSAVNSRAHIVSVARGIVTLCVAVFVASAPSTARAGGVVGTGSAASCTDAALNTALGGGGLVTFDCGGSATIDISPPATGTKTIAADTTIDGGGMVTISGGNSVRVLSVNSGVNFTVQNLTIANGNSAGDGGGISNNGGTVTVTNSTFSGNRASGTMSGGGGISGKGGTVAVTNSTFSKNSAAAGGGIFNNTGGGTLTVTNSTFSDNSASGGGGLVNHTGGTLTVTNSTFSGNSATSAGGILNNTGGTLTVTNSTFSNNSAHDGGSGGGIYNNPGGTATVTNSTFSGNSADDSYGDGGGLLNNGGTLTVTSSTFSGNSANSYAGGLSNDNGGTLTVTNSTFSGNSAGYGGAGIFNNGTLMVTNSTFSGNSANGGGIYSYSGTSTVTNTILANSTSGGNCAGSVTDGGHNIDDGTTCGFTGNGCANTSGSSFCRANPKLDPAGLASNGGLTQTIALQAGSPAVNAGNEPVCAGPPVNNLDQRGYLRPGTDAASCSIGAYEYNSPGSPTPSPTPVPTATPTSPPALCVGDCGGTHTVAINNLITLVSIALGTAQASACARGIPNGAEVNIALLIQAVNNALYGCPLTPAEQGCLGSGGTGTRIALSGRGRVCPAVQSVKTPGCAKRSKSLYASWINAVWDPALNAISASSASVAATKTSIL